MLWSLKHLLDYALLTTDGQREPVLTTLFDEATWELRYLIAQPTGFSPIPVMIALIAINPPNRTARALPVELTAEQVKNSPTIVPEMLMSPSTQKRLNACYALYQYWALSGYATSSLPLALISSPEVPQSETRTFRDAQDVLAMTVSATNGELGPVDDLLVDDDDAWAIRYLIVNDPPETPGRPAWIPPELVKSVRWQERRLSLGVSRSHVRTAPQTQPHHAIPPKEVMPMHARNDA